ncbi:MAG: J domain-containing protein [Candidatus Electrothrix sp.]
MINSLCQRYQISLTYLTRELNHIQNIFAPQKNISDNHKILGLQAGAHIAEVKQAYRKLSIKYHPDTSNKNDTSKFIEITKAYQRIINNTDKEENNASPSPSAWRHRKNTPPPPQQREKKYLYLFSLITGAIILVIVSISINYQKRAMLKNISKVTRAPSPVKPLTKKIPPIVEDHSTKDYVFESSTPAVQTQVREQEQLSLPTSKISEQLSHQVSQDDITFVPLTSENIAQIQHLAFEEQSDIEVKKFSSPISSSHVQTENNDSKKSDQEEKEDGSIVEVGKRSDLFSDILEQEQPAEERIKKVTAPAGAVQHAPKQENSSSVFSGARYHKALVVKPRERKVRTQKARTKKLSAQDTEQSTPSISIQQSLREFVQSYTTVYMSRDIEKFSLFFAKGALENDVLFSKIRQKYKQLFNATTSIEYSIDLLETDIRDKGASLTGRFKVQLIYTSKKITSNTGTITFFLVKVQGRYKIKALSYHLDPKW